MTTLDEFEDFLDGALDEVLRNTIGSISEVDESNDVRTNEKCGIKHTQNTQDGTN